jgi:hypothetical protein
MIRGSFFPAHLPKTCAKVAGGHGSFARSILLEMLMTSPDYTAEEWFQEAARCYVEGHQGCAWCRGPYRVFRRREGNHLTYSCHRCDFRACFEEQRGRYFFIPGEKRVGGPVPDTMYEI